MILDSQPQSTTQDPGTIGSTNLVSNGEHVNNWIIDSGAIDHMTYDHNDFKTKSVPRQKAISNANDDIYLVTGEEPWNYQPYSLFLVLFLFFYSSLNYY